MEFNWRDGIIQILIISSKDVNIQYFCKIFSFKKISGKRVSKLEPLWEGSLLFTIKFPEVAGIYQSLKDEQHKYQNPIQRKEYQSLCG